MDTRIKKIKIFYKLCYGCLVSDRWLFRILGWRISGLRPISLNNDYRYIEVYYKSLNPFGVKSSKAKKIINKKILNIRTKHPRELINAWGCFDSYFIDGKRWDNNVF